MRITFVTRKCGNVERNSHCDVLHFTPVRVARLFLDCNGVFAIKAYVINFRLSKVACVDLALFFLILHSTDRNCMYCACRIATYIECITSVDVCETILYIIHANNKTTE